MLALRNTDTGRLVTGGSVTGVHLEYNDAKAPVRFTTSANLFIWLSYADVKIRDIEIVKIEQVPQPKWRVVETL